MSNEERVMNELIALREKSLLDLQAIIVYVTDELEEHPDFLDDIHYLEDELTKVLGAVTALIIKYDL